MSNATLRFEKQAGIIPQDRLAALEITVIGVGAVGRQVALQLAAAGARMLHLIDPDTVDVTNIASQGFAQQTVGQAKVHAVKATIEAMDSEILVRVTQQRYMSGILLGHVIMCCVDSIESRGAIWRNVSRHWGEPVACFIDGRMLAETLRILAVDSTPELRAHYPTTLFAAAAGAHGTCATHAAIYAAAIAAGLMVQQLVAYLRGETLRKDQLLNLTAGELIQL